MACAPQVPIIVYRGRSFAPLISLVDPCTLQPIDTTPYTEIAVSVVGTSGCVTVLFSLAQVLKISPLQGGQIQPKFTSANTLLFALTDPTQAAAGNYTPITVKLTNASNPDQNPYVLVIPAANAAGISSGILNILDSPC